MICRRRRVNRYGLFTLEIDSPLNDNHETLTLHIAFVDSADKL